MIGKSMTTSKDQRQRNSSVHNFNEEYKILLIFGGFVIIKEPYFGRILNLILITCDFLLYAFLIVMSVITVTLKSEDRIVVVKLVQTLCVLAFAVLMPALRYRARHHLDAAIDLLKQGVYNYKEEENKVHMEIKRHRVSQVRKLESILVKGCFFCALLNTALVPVKNLIFTDYDPNDILNPYLPLPIYMPFNTKNNFNFVVAFLSNALFNFILFFATLFSTLITYSSCALQLIAQLEILANSLKNIKFRAYSKLVRKCLQMDETKLTDRYRNYEFQRSLLSCLRENVLHHHAILRFVEYTAPFFDAVNVLAATFFSIILAAAIMAMAESIQTSSLNLEVIGTVLIDVCGFFLMCCLGQFIRDKSEEITTFLYSTPWPYCDKNFNYLLKMMIMKTQHPITLKAPVFNMDMSLATFGDSASAGYKITTLLR